MKSKMSFLAFTLWMVSCTVGTAMAMMTPEEQNIAAENLQELDDL